MRRSEGPLAQNIGKRSIVVNLKTDDGLAIAKRLAAAADVLVQNYRPGALGALGLGYEALQALNPRLVYVSISGFGSDTSFAKRGAFGATAHAEAGWLWVQQQAQGGPEPFPPGITVADIATGMNAAMAVLAALYDCERTGAGQAIDISLMDSQLAFLAEAAGPALNPRPSQPWTPFRHGLQRARDGWLAVNLGPPRLWPRLAEAMGQPGLPMPAPRSDAEAMLAAWVAGHTVDEAVRALESADVPYGVVRSIHEAVEHPYFAERGMFVDVPDPLDGTLKAVASPLRFSSASTAPAGPSPIAGEHTREVLSELGYSPEEIDRLRDAGVVETV